LGCGRSLSNLVGMQISVPSSDLEDLAVLEVVVNLHVECACGYRMVLKKTCEQMGLRKTS
jgi:hypothetical protein